MLKKDNLSIKFRKLLLQWNKEENRRQMPWKGEKNPYKIWLSEIILQQTRVEQGFTYYQKFIDSFPEINDLANASDTKVYKMWEGLGYYSRCKNLLETARRIVNRNDGNFPKTYEEILQLKGVGGYTAAAIASFAYNLPYAVLDGNVFRVLSRFFGVSKAIDTTEGKKYFTKLANELLDKKQPGIYNQAIMDFGAMVCKPVAPLCLQCVFKKHCHANSTNSAGLFPQKSKKIKIQTRWFYYLVIKYKNQFYIRQRIENDIWKNLYEFNVLEFELESSSKDVLKKAEKLKIIKKKEYQVLTISSTQKQQLSHQKIFAQFIAIQLFHKETIPDMKLVTKKEILEFAFPKIINNYFMQYLAAN